MNLRDRRGAITPAEGCMFAAVVLFVILLLLMIYVVFVRFGDRPRSAPAPQPVGVTAPTMQLGATAWDFRASGGPVVLDLELAARDG